MTHYDSLKTLEGSKGVRLMYRSIRVAIVTKLTLYKITYTFVHVYLYYLYCSY